MGAGGAREFPHRLGGPLPAGNYHLVVTGYQSTYDGVLLGEIFHRPGSDAGTGGTLIGSATGVPPAPGPGMLTYLDAMISAGAVNAACGDTLVVRISYQSGTSDFYEIYVTLDTP